MGTITASELIKNFDGHWMIEENKPNLLSFANFKLRLKINIEVEFITNFIDKLTIKNWITEKHLWSYDGMNDVDLTAKTLVIKIEKFAQTDRLQKFD